MAQAAAAADMTDPQGAKMAVARFAHATFGALGLDDKELFARAVGWTLAAALAFASSWYLLIHENYCHPLHLHCFQMVLAGAVALVQTCASEKASSSSLWESAMKCPPRFNRQMAWLVLAALSLAWAMPLFLKALLYSQNPTLLVSCLALTFAFESAANALLDRRASARALLGISASVLSCAMVVLDDYRASSRTLAQGSHALLLLGIARLAFSRATKAEHNDGNRFDARECWNLLPKITIPASLALTLVWLATRKDRIQGFTALMDTNAWAVAVNVLAAAAAMHAGGSVIMFFFPDADADAIAYANDDATTPLPSPTQLFCGLSLAIIALALPFPAIVTPLQVCLSVIAFVLLLQPRGGALVSLPVDETTATTNTNGYQPLWQRLTPGSGAKSRTSLTARAGPVIVAIVLLALAIRALTTAWLLTSSASLAATLPGTAIDLAKPFNPAASGSAANLDCGYTAPHTLDVVISMYDEPISSIEAISSALAGIPAFSALDAPPRLHIYTKHNGTDPEQLKEATGAHAVTRLPNVGREGHTYLHHILSHWDALAHQTLFLQAEPHYLSQAFARLDAAYTPATGMISLGDSGYTCACGACGDLNWHDTAGTIAQVYEAVNSNRTCAPGKRVLLSYRGQFLASAARIRGVGRGVYEGLNWTLTAPESWAWGDEWRFDERENSANAPQFGYTLERLWNVLMQCAEGEGRVARLCPGIRQGMPRWAGAGDCACEDVCGGGGEEGRGG